MSNSYIAIHGIPGQWPLAGTVKLLAKVVSGYFTALNFTATKNNKKTLYLQLSKYIDPLQVIERITSTPIKKCFLKASIPSHVPDSILKAKPKKLPFRIRKNLGIRDELSLDVVLQLAHAELLVELQSKYTGLYNLSRKSEHKLLDNISEALLLRLLETVERNPDSLDNGFVLTKAYRKQYPHHEDFKLITSINKKLGGGEINKTQFTTVSTHPYAIDNIPYDQIQKICNKYSEKISKEMTQHLQSLPVQPDLNADTEDDIARKKVRVELKKIIPYLPLIIKQVIAQNFIPDKSPYHRVRVYGEPFIPPKESLTQLLKRHRAVKISRSDRIYNLLKFNIPPQEYGSIMAMDGTVIGGATLVFRSSDMPMYKVPKELTQRILAYCGVDDMNDEFIGDDIGGDYIDEDLGDDYIDQDIGDEYNDEDIGNSFRDEIISEHQDEENWNEEW